LLTVAIASTLAAFICPANELQKKGRKRPAAVVAMPDFREMLLLPPLLGHACHTGSNGEEWLFYTDGGLFARAG